MYLSSRSVFTKKIILKVQKNATSSKKKFHVLQDHEKEHIYHRKPMHMKSEALFIRKNLLKTSIVNLYTQIICIIHVVYTSLIL